MRDRLQPTNVEKGNLVHALEQFQGYAFQKGLTPGKLGPPAFYDVQVAVGEDGLLEGCAGPEVSLLVRQLLDGVLEQGRELAAEEIEVLFAGRRTPVPCHSIATIARHLEQFTASTMAMTGVPPAAVPCAASSGLA